MRERYHSTNNVAQSLIIYIVDCIVYTLYIVIAACSMWEQHSKRCMRWKKHLFHIWKPTGIQTNNMSCEFFLYMTIFLCICSICILCMPLTLGFQQTFDLNWGNEKKEKRLPVQLLAGNRYSWAFTLFHSDEQTHTLLHIIPINYIQSKFNEKMKANVNPLLVSSESLCNDDNDQPFSFSHTHTHTHTHLHRHTARLISQVKLM